MALWGGHYLSTPAGSVWFAGDTGYGDGRIFQQIRKHCGHVDLALIPIGAYEPRWFMAAQHVDPAEAVQIFRDIEASQALGIHWGTFQLTNEAREAPQWHLRRLSRRQLSRPIVFLPLNPEEFTTSGDCETYSASLATCSLFCPQVRIRLDESACVYQSIAHEKRVCRYESRKRSQLPVARYPPGIG